MLKACSFSKKRFQRVLFCEIWEVFKSTFLNRTPPVAASWYLFLLKSELRLCYFWCDCFYTKHIFSILFNFLENTERYFLKLVVPKFQNCKEILLVILAKSLKNIFNLANSVRWIKIMQKLNRNFLLQEWENLL